MSKLSLSGKIQLATPTPITFSTRQTVMVEQFIASHGSLTLAAIDTVLTEAQKRRDILNEKIRNREVAAGIDIGVINECKRIPLEKRNKTQQEIANWKTESRATENMTIDQYLTEQLEAERLQVAEWLQIRQIFVDIYPESKTSPRLSRSELEKSPSRQIAKSLSQPALPSPRLTPRKQLKKETD